MDQFMMSRKRVYTNLNVSQNFLTTHSLILSSNSGKHPRITAGNRKGMKDAGTSNVTEVSRKP